MSLHSYSPHNRYSRRSRERTANFFKSLIVILIVAGVGFWMGQQYAKARLGALGTRIQMMETENLELQKTVTELRAEAQTANTRFSQLKQEYDEAIPEGPIRDLIVLLREQLKQGMQPERLSFLLRSARPPTGCTDPETKRFVVSTPVYRAKESAVSLANGALLVSASGASSTNEKGQPEAWYDPAKPIVIEFKSGGIVETKKGVFPIKHSVVVGDREYRMTVEQGSKSFAKVVFDSCNYP